MIFDEIFAQSYKEKEQTRSFSPIAPLCGKSIIFVKWICILFLNMQNNRIDYVQNKINYA